MNLKLLFAIVLMPVLMYAQHMSPEILWSLGRVSAVGISADEKFVVYSVNTPDIQDNSFTKKLYKLNIALGHSSPVSDTDNELIDTKISPDGSMTLNEGIVKLLPVAGTDFYADLPQSESMIYNELHFRHWDHFEDGRYSHVFLKNINTGEQVDLMSGEPYYCPTVPFGDAGDYIWSPDGAAVIYVCKKKSGTEYVNSTNTDLYKYTLATAKTENLTKGNSGYDTHPQYSSNGTLAWLSMERDGYESDKNDLKILTDGGTANLTENWDGTVNSFLWNKSGTVIYFTAPSEGTVQLFSVSLGKGSSIFNGIKQITHGEYDITDLVGFAENDLIVGRTDMNHAKELYALNTKNGEMRQLSHVNDTVYADLTLSTIESRNVTTTDGKSLLTWVIYPPDFDATQKYPTLLYTQGGPQSALSQFYSFRWNFQLMAAMGYIVVAPNRRGMPGFGMEWNEEISTDWGGQAMADYLAAIDDMAKEPFVDQNRIGCVGASYGGYSAFYLAGTHEKRFRTFIAHDGVFNLRSMYGTTEELFFMNWDLGGAYWENDNTAAQKSYTTFNPINYVSYWDSPILIITGGKDYRVPESQAFEAFTAAQQRGIKSRLLYFPEENHWVLTPQNGLLWQREFFKWLDETLK